MNKYIAYNLSMFNEEQTQSFLKDMKKKGYNTYYYEATCKIMLVAFNVYTKKLVYVFDEKMYSSFKEARERLLNILLPSETIIFKAPDIRIMI